MLWVKSVLTYNKLLNPLNFVSADYVRKRFNDQEEVQTIEAIY